MWGPNEYVNFWCKSLHQSKFFIIFVIEIKKQHSKLPSRRIKSASKIMKKEIRIVDLSLAVATTNADPFCVENETEAAFILEEWGKAEKKTLTPSDEDFEEWAARLDFTEVMPRKIYVGTLPTHQVAFVLTKDNPYYN